MKMVRENKNECNGCGICKKLCKHEAIKLTKDKNGFVYPMINTDICVGCNICLKACKTLDNDLLTVKSAYAVKIKDKKQLMSSTSGGIFTAISDYVLNNRGVVYGCVLDDEKNAVHKRAETKEQRDAMRDSKYVQSSIINVYDNVVKDLKEGKMVLFTGTPCQTAAIHRYCVSKECANQLYLCDIVCHGVASPDIFKQHIKYIEEKEKIKVSKIVFRDKNLGWNKDHKRRLKCISSDGKIIYDDMFYKMYFNYNIISRPSCSKCRYSNVKRCSDFTMADYWGIENIHPEFENTNGVSLLMIRSQKGANLFSEIKDRVDYIETNIDSAVQYNPRLKSPTVFPGNYNSFWSDYKVKGYKYVLNHYVNPNFTIRIENKLKRIYKRIRRR